jgi:protein-S-isoprenylcysteine O-methyltransferase Ste14
MSVSTLWTWLTEAWVVGEIIVAIATRARGSAKVQDRGTQIILWIVIFGSFTISGFMKAALHPNMPGLPWLIPVALGLLIAGLIIRTTAIVTLGRSFTANVATHAAQTIQRSGLYRIVRHPSYLGLEIIFLAAALHTRTWACFAVILIPPTIALLYRIHVEEIALRGAFGEDYVAYSRTTKRLIPGIY